MIPLLSRRTTLGAGLAAAGVAAAGCSVRVPGSAAPTASPAPRPGSLEPDVQIVVDLVNAMLQSVALVKGTTTRHPELAARLTPLLALHQAHLAELRRAAPAKSLAKAPVFAITVPARAPKALAAVLERTQALREECNASAVRAESGSFARLLAGVGAGLAQRLALLEAPVRSAG